MKVVRTSDEPYRPLYEYSVATVSDLLLCLRPHVLRAVRGNLQSIEGEFIGERAIEVSRLIEQIDELLVDLDGEA